MDIMEQTKKENHKCESWLLHFEERKEEYVRARESILGASPSASLVDITAIAGISDKTGKLAAQLSKMHYQEKWIKLIEYVCEQLPPDKQVYLQLRRDYRYCKGKKGWTSQVQYRFARELAKKLGRPVRAEDLRHRATFHGWWENIVNLTAREAAKRGLI